MNAPITTDAFRAEVLAIARRAVLLNEPNAQAVSDAQVDEMAQWLCALWVAEQMRDLTQKELAEALLQGIQQPSVEALIDDVFDTDGDDEATEENAMNALDAFNGYVGH